MSIYKHFSWIAVCVILSSQAWGQAANSPFSQFGLGQTYSDALANTQGAGGIGVSQPQPWFVNNQNPALLVYNAYTSFQAGMIVERTSISSNYISEKHSGGNMNYLVTAFPILRAKKVGPPSRWATSLGLMPYSTIKYKFRTTEPIEGQASLAPVTYEGRGGLTQLYWANGVRINRNFSVGLKTTYLFGSTYTITKFNDGQLVVQDIEDKNFLKDFTFTAGGSYSRDSIFGSSCRLNVGAVYGFGKNARTEHINKFAQLGSLGDTISGTASSISERGFTHIPASITAGISISKGANWSLGTEYKYQNWSSFTTPNRKYNLMTSWRFSVGGEFTPEPDAVEGFLKRVTYRVGVVSEQYPYLVSTTQVKDLGVNFGFSIPAGRSSLDFAFKIGKRGNKTETSIEENYFKVYFGITFNDIWFIRRKFD